MNEEITHEERIKKISGKLKCAPPSPRFKVCRNNDAEYVCHECGSPLCHECGRGFTDRRFYYLSSGVKRVLIAIAILILLPTLTAVLSNYLAVVSVVGGIFSALILFLALLSTVELLRRDEYDQVGESVSKTRIVFKNYINSVHCRRCAKQHSTESNLTIGVKILGIIFILLGIYSIVRGAIAVMSINGALILMSFGIALLIARNIIVELSTVYIPKLLRLQ